MFGIEVKQQLLNNLKEKILKSGEMGLGDFLSKELSQEERDLLMSFRIKEVFSFDSTQTAVKKEEKKEPKTHIVGEDEEIYKAKVLAFLKEKGLGESLRGFKNSEITDVCGGDSTVLRKILDKLEEEKLVHPTGNTRGKRWVAKEFAKQADKNFLTGKGKGE